MNTEQKARAWVTKVENGETGTDTYGIITALLKEREAFESRIAEIEKPYVPMTDDYFDKVLQNIPHYSDAALKWDYERNLEAAVIKRYNEQRSMK